MENEVAAGVAQAMAVVQLVSLAVMVLMTIGMWKIFSKAGQPGWASLIPFFNMYVLLKVAGRPGWWLVLLFIPLVNLVILILVGIDLAKAFGKGVGYGLGLTFLSPIFYPLLGFSDDPYQG
ncbi:DUF5684 domain-containing protein [Anaeromyxobacter oryzae]|uniref:Signal peptidase I n=1 Tax=Anaeromyxobacter oryzae TaxID=2918170 RepID=A0ABN6MVQ9_9BACT|nr:DUF5684 domain-containing protein [Anaeromyxobacter oryzae]BDG03765.1 hypothetical protein AMOR_27610 [Anaeromyxobacter oryzae]